MIVVVYSVQRNMFTVKNNIGCKIYCNSAWKSNHKHEYIRNHARDIKLLYFFVT